LDTGCNRLMAVVQGWLAGGNPLEYKMHIGFPYALFRWLIHMTTLGDP
jgi:hypothetical protein